MSRISTQMMYQRALTAMLNQQGKLATTQLQLSTGRRVLTPADDPASASRVLGLNGAIDTVAQYQDNADRARARLETEEGVLIGVTNLLQRSKELAVQGNNATLTLNDAQALASEAQQLLNEMFSLGNTRDSTGEYIFAGYQSGTRPFENIGAGNYSYNGDLGQRMLQISSNRQIADGDNGFALFVDVATGPVATSNGISATAAGAAVAISAGEITIDGGNGNGAVSLRAIPSAADPAGRATQLRDAINAVSGQTGVRAAVDAAGTALQLSAVGGTAIDITLSGAADSNSTGLTAGSYAAVSGKRDVFETLYQFASELESGNPVDRYLADIQLALDHVVDARAGVGARMNALDTQQEINADLKLVLESHRSEEQDLDYTEAITRFELQQVSLQAAQQAYVQVQRLSLFDYL